LGEPVNTGKNGEYLQRARDLVSAYNVKAPELAAIVGQLIELRNKMNDAVGAGGCIISSAGWTGSGSALEVIPKLRMFDSEFPVVLPSQAAKEFLDNRVATALNFLNSTDEFSNPGYVSVSDERTRVNSTVNAAETLAKKAVEYQYNQMKSGKSISMTDAVAFVKSYSFSEKASVQSGGMAPANSKINNDIVTAAAMADILARDAVELQKREKESGRIISMTDAVARIKEERGMMNVPATALYVFTKPAQKGA
jgi:hypothetical protein